MACSADTPLDGSVLAEQQDEVTALESIFLEDFTLLSDGDEPISFNLSLKVQLPQDKIDLEAWISVEEEGHGDISSSEGHGTGVRNELEEMEPPSPREQMDDVAAEYKMVGAVGGVEQVDAVAEDEELMLGAVGGLKVPTKFALKRSVSRRHLHLSTELHHLTPINIRCVFHPQYPGEQPPFCHLSCLWLNTQQLTALQHQLQSVWWEFPNQPIVFTWVDWLQNHALEHLGLDTHITLKETVDDNNDVDIPQDQSGAQFAPTHQGRATTEMALFNILEYDLEKQKEEFMKDSHTCDICFETKDGPEFQFLTDCRHSFCTECLRFHCEIRIKDGSVLRLYCPDQECKTVVSHTVLQEILKPEMFERWEKLVLSKALDTMGDIVYCPRCNTCVVADDVESSKLAQCVQCFHTFCIDCLEAWHHDKPCGVGDEAYARNEPDNDPDGGQRKKRRRNKRHDNGNTDEATDHYSHKDERTQRKKKEHGNVSGDGFIRLMKVKGHFQRCPKCRFYVEKISGCDFMHCSQCGSGFCWACGKAINSYGHFGNCGQTGPGREFVVPERRPTEADRILERFRENNPGKTLEFVNCPRCRQKNLRGSTNNHLKCWACKTDLCCQCRKEIKGAITSHFLPSMPCSQHSEQ